MRHGFGSNLTPKLIIQATISIAILVVGLTIILGEHEPGSKNWAYGMVASILTYWFKGK
jgi:hypothetical protein